VAERAGARDTLIRLARHPLDSRTRIRIRTPKAQEGSDAARVTAGESAYGEYERRQSR
jgi:hypothetical protein